MRIITIRLPRRLDGFHDSVAFIQTWKWKREMGIPDFQSAFPRRQVLIRGHRQTDRQTEGRTDGRTGGRAGGRAGRTGWQAGGRAGGQTDENAITICPPSGA
ncbi:hypothetical protein DPMN_076113 [Dreissena polymorpha]|uniref:Uncharacterized protein n=1 Tax=Dreissena polymorpha TaxID=45954 RepID=A0A9D3YI83_DREPO|nr:hypothetical protein DPMN_076113 [Dreissena polymorpha]